MNKYVKDMLELSKIDNELDSYKPLIENINNKVKEEEKKLKDILAQKEKIKKLIEDSKIKIITFESQIKEEKNKLDEIQKKSALVKNEKEAFALSSEEHIAKDKISFANEEIERLNKIIKVKEEELEELLEQEKEEEERLKEIKNEAENELKKIEESKRELLEKRDKLTRQMERKILSFYEKIRKWAGNTVVVPVKKQACYGCFLKINDKAYSDLIIGEEIVTCPHCGRVLYIEKDKVEA